MNQELINTILNRYLKEYNYKITYFEYNESCFGNFIIILKSKKGVTFKLLRDKGQLYCNVKSFCCWLDINKIVLSDSIYDMDEETEIAISHICIFLNENMKRIKFKIYSI